MNGFFGDQGALPEGEDEMLLIEIDMQISIESLEALRESEMVVHVIASMRG